MEPELAIEPHQGIGPARLGMEPAEIHAALSPLPGALDGHSRDGSIEFFFGNALQVEYGSTGRASFFGASYYPGCGCSFSLRGTNPWALSSEALFAWLAELDGGAHEYTPTEYLFPRIIVSLWEAGEQHDHLGRESKPVWAQVGIGDAEYLAGVQAIQASP